MGYGDRMKDMEPFWEGYRSHFASLGINLCSMRKGGVWAVPQWEAAASAQHPFASCCTHDALDGPALYDLSSRTLPVCMACKLSLIFSDVHAYCSAAWLMPRIRGDETSLSSLQTKHPWNTRYIDIWPKAIRSTTVAMPRVFYPRQQCWTRRTSLHSL